MGPDTVLAPFSALLGAGMKKSSILCANVIAIIAIAWIVLRHPGPDNDEIESIAQRLIDCTKKKRAARCCSDFQDFHLKFGHRANLVIAHLESMLDDNDIRVVIDAAGAINAVAPENPLPVQKLVKRLDDSQGTKPLIVESIGKHGSHAKIALPSLIALLSSRDEIVLCASAQTLGAVGPDAREAIPSLIPLLEHRSDDVVVSVAQSLGEMQEDARGAVPALIHRYSRSNTRVRIAIIQSLGSIGSDRETILEFLGTILDDGTSGPNEIVFTLNNLPQLMIDGHLIVQKAKSLTSHREERVRQAAIWVCDQANPPLVQFK